MTPTLAQAQRYAQLKKTRVIKDAYKIEGDSITFVMESGPKLTFTGEELTKEIEALESALAKEQAILAIQTGAEPKAEPKPKKKAEPKPKKKAEPKPKKKAEPKPEA